MSFRVFEGNILSAEGWRMCNADECVWVKIPGAENVSIQVRSGYPATILPAFVARYNQLVEPVRDPDTACWTLTNDVSTSNHPAGVAVDVNWSTHPFHVKGTFGDRLAALRQVQQEFRGCVWWGGDWTDPIDEMHHELNYPEGYIDKLTKQFVLAVDQRIIDLANDLRAGYLGIYVPGQTPTPSSANAADVLVRATGVTADKAQEILVGVINGLRDSQCNNVNRIAMWLAQMGHESAGFNATEEYASGAAYEGRADLGNTQPGDGVRFKGRSWIQITGRSNYTKLSQWAFSQGLVPSATYFIDDSTRLAQMQYAGLGPAWYWVVARPQINGLCDAGNLTAVTQAINGGQNGAADRKTRYDRALALGDQLLQLTTDTGEDDLSAEAERQIGVIYQELTKKFASRSPLRHLDQTQYYPGGLVDTMAGMVLNTDGSEHVQYVSLLASYGHPGTLALLREVAGADPQQYPDRQDDAKLAQAILAEATAAPVSFAPVDTTPPAAPQPQVVYLPAPVSGGSTGQVIGQAYDALEALLVSGALTDAEKTPLNALIGVLQTKSQGVEA